MNVERLLTVAEALTTDLRATGLEPKLNALRQALEKFSSQPQISSHQVAVAEAKTELRAALMASKVNSFPPLWQQVLEEVGFSAALGENLVRRLDEVFLQNDLTPAAALEPVAGLEDEVTLVSDTLEAAISSLKTLRFKPENLEPGDCEVAVLIPRIAVENDLETLSDEMNAIRRIIGPFQELTLGSRPKLEVRSLSSSDFGLYLALDPVTAAAVAVACERILAFYKNILEIRKLQGELKGQKVPASAMKGLREYVAKVMAEGIEETVTELLNTYGREIEAARKNELQNELRARLNGIANRVDKGYGIDVTCSPDPDIDRESADAHALHVVEAASPNLRFLNPTGEPVLSLPESIEETPPPRKRTQRTAQRK